MAKSPEHGALPPEEALPEKKEDEKKELLTLEDIEPEPQMPPPKNIEKGVKEEWKKMTEAIRRGLQEKPAPLLPKSEAPENLPTQPSMPETPAKIEELPRKAAEKKIKKSPLTGISAFFSKILRGLETKVRVKSGRKDFIDKELFEPKLREVLAEQIHLAQEETEKYKEAPKGIQRDRQRDRMMIAWREVLHLYERGEKELKIKEGNLFHNLETLRGISKTLKEKIKKATSGTEIHKLKIALGNNKRLIEDAKENAKSLEELHGVMGQHRNQIEKNLQKLGKK